jgi:MacB-like periplasmic core domain/FtsX-like permease family
MLAKLKSLILNLARKRKKEEELDAEVRGYAEMLADEKVRGGMKPEQARRAARIELGGVEQVKEQVRDARASAWLDSLLQDVRYGARVLRKNPGFTVVAFFTLALGIGANTAIFSLIDALLLRTLPVASPHELVLFSDSPEGGANSGTQTGRWSRFSSENYAYFRGHGESFKELCAFQSGWNDLKIRVAGRAGRPGLAHGRLVSGNFFSFLSLKAAAGRLFAPSDDQPGASPVAVLNYTYWTRKFHDDLSAIGTVVQINGTAFTIIGVGPRAFSDVKDDHPDLWLPLLFQPQVMSTSAYADDPQMYWLNIMARLKPGVTLRHAQTVVNVQWKQILATPAHRETTQQIANSYIELAPGEGGISYLRFTYAAALQVLAGIVGIVLLIACANVAKLLLSRSSAREKEISIRLAMGASRSKLIRQLLTESMLLAGIGGALGIVAARWGVETLASLVTGTSSAAKAARIDPQAGGYNPGETPALYQALIDRVEAIPGVLAATVDYSEPFGGSTWTSNFSIEGVPLSPAGEMMVHKELVGPHYFETEGFPFFSAGTSVLRTVRVLLL